MMIFLMSSYSSSSSSSRRPPPPAIAAPRPEHRLAGAATTTTTAAAAAREQRRPRTTLLPTTIVVIPAMIIVPVDIDADSHFWAAFCDRERRRRKRRRRRTPPPRDRRRRRRHHRGASHAEYSISPNKKVPGGLKSNSCATIDFFTHSFIKCVFSKKSFGFFVRKKTRKRGDKDRTGLIGGKQKKTKKKNERERQERERAVFWILSLPPFTCPSTDQFFFFLSTSESLNKRAVDFLEREEKRPIVCLFFFRRDASREHKWFPSVVCAPPCASFVRGERERERGRETKGEKVVSNDKK